MKISVIVEADIPDGVSEAEWVYYVQQEVRCNVGCLDPHEPLFHLDRETVKAKIVKTNENNC
jgi:hypothetical protein